MDILTSYPGEGRGRIFVGDVGDDDYEEMTIVQSGGNLGWPIFEGPMCLKPENCANIGKRIIFTVSMSFIIRSWPEQNACNQPYCFYQVSGSN